jgi:hypothetical protein
MEWQILDIYYKQKNKLTGHKLKQTTIKQRHEILIEILIEILDLWMKYLSNEAVKIVYILRELYIKILMTAFPIIFIFPSWNLEVYTYSCTNFQGTLPNSFWK